MATQAVYVELDLKTNKIVNLGDPREGLEGVQDAATRNYVDEAIADVESQAGGKVASVTGTAPIGVNNTDPTAPVISLNPITNANIAAGAGIDQSKISGLDTSLAAKADKITKVTTEGGLTGGGTLAADMTIGIADGGVTTAKIADGAVTGQQLNAALADLNDVSSVTPATGQVLTYVDSGWVNAALPVETVYTASNGVTKVANDFQADGSVVRANGSVAFTAPQGGVNGVAATDLATLGQVATGLAGKVDTSTGITGNNGITTSGTLGTGVTVGITDLGVTTAKIADLAVTTGKIDALAVTEGKIAASAVTTGKIADLNVTTDKLAAGAVTNAKLDASLGGLNNVAVAADAATTGHVLTKTENGWEAAALPVTTVPIQGVTSIAPIVTEESTGTVTVSIDTTTLAADSALKVHNPAVGTARRITVDPDTQAVDIAAEYDEKITAEIVGAFTNHINDSDPHIGYQLESQKGAINGYASLGADGKVPWAELPAFELANTHTGSAATPGDIPALTPPAGPGDIYVSTEGWTAIYAGDAWVELSPAHTDVSSVNGLTGSITIKGVAGRTTVDAGVGNITVDVDKAITDAIAANTAALPTKVTQTRKVLGGAGLVNNVVNETGELSADVTLDVGKGVGILVDANTVSLDTAYTDTLYAPVVHGHAGTEITFDNTGTGLVASDVQAALVEIDGIADDAVAAAAANATAIDSLQGELDATQAGAGLNADGGYVPDTNTTFLKTAANLFDADKKLDAEIARVEGMVTGGTGNIQGELDKTQVGAGLATDGAYVKNDGANYIAEATSLNDADVKLDTALKTVDDRSTTNASNISGLQTEMTATQAGAGLETDGTYGTVTGTNYLNASTSLKGADALLDAAIKSVADTAAGSTTNLQKELDDTQTGAGLGANGAYTAPTGTNYLNAATSLKNADVALDSAIKGVSDAAAGLGDRLTIAEGGITTNAGAIEDLDGRLTAAEGTITTQGTSISTNASDIAALETTVGGHTTSIGTLQESVSTNTSNIADNSGRIATLETIHAAARTLTFSDVAGVQQATVTGAPGGRVPVIKVDGCVVTMAVCEQVAGTYTVTSNVTVDGTATITFG